MEPKEYRISEMSKIVGVSTETLRFYEKKGILVSKKKQNGYRYYTEDDVKNFMWILYNRKSNFSLDELCSWRDEDASDFEIHFKENVLQKIKSEQSTLLHHLRILKRLSLILEDLDAVNSHLNEYSLKAFPCAHIIKTCPDYRSALEEWYKLASADQGLDMTYFYSYYDLDGDDISAQQIDLLLYAGTEQAMDSSFPLEGLAKTESRLCVYTIIKTDNDELPAEVFYNMKDWAKKKRIGNGIIRLLQYHYVPRRYLFSVLL